MPQDDQPGTVVDVGIIGGAVLLILALVAWEWREPSATAPEASTAAGHLAAFDEEVAAAQNQADVQRQALERILGEQRERARGLVAPGPEPAWYHPMDHLEWSTRKAAFDQGIKALQDLQARSREAQLQLKDALRTLTDRQRLAALAHRAYAQDRPGELPIPLRDGARWLWNHLLRPLLHWLLILSLMLFVIRLAMRLALIRGWLHEQRLREPCEARDATRGAAGVAPVLSPNGIALTLAPGERFWVHASLVQGRASYEWRLLPPHPLGSVLSRWWHRMYFGLAYVEGGSDGPTLELRGIHPRGNFLLVTLAAGEEYHIRQHRVCGYSATLARLHTRLRFWPTFWVLHRHFIACYQGPGNVLIYAETPLEVSDDLAFPPERVVAFNLDRRFKAQAPMMRSAQGRLMNRLWSHDVSWRFLDPGRTIVEAHVEGDHADQRTGVVRRWIGHALGFLRL